MSARVSTSTAWWRAVRCASAGLELDHTRGLEGHSDGDCVLHAVCDALLGAIGAGDMGSHFPSRDPRWHGVASRVFVEEVSRLVSARGFRLGNLDLTVIAQEPVLAPHLDGMRATIAVAPGGGRGGGVGQGQERRPPGRARPREGIAALATVLLVKEAPDE